MELEPGNTAVGCLLQELQQRTATAQSPPQQQQQRRVPWAELNKLRSSLKLSLVPSDFVVGSQYLPSPDGINANLLLLLHSLGDTPKAFTALAKRMVLPHTACLALSGPLRVPETNGGRAWYKAIDQHTGELIQPVVGETRRLESLVVTLQLLQQTLLPALSAAGGWQPQHIQLLGFSQGGTVALELARRCRGNSRLGGVVAVSAALLEEELASSSTITRGHRSSAGASAAVAAAAGSTCQEHATDVLITHGGKDTVVSRSSVDRSVDLLQQAACTVRLKTLSSKGHGMINSQEEMRACMEFWAKRLRSRPADKAFEEMPA